MGGNQQASKDMEVGGKNEKEREPLGGEFMNKILP